MSCSENKGKSEKDEQLRERIEGLEKWQTRDEVSEWGSKESK